MAATTPDINLFMHFKFEKNDYLKNCPKVQYRRLVAYIGPPVMVYWTGLYKADKTQFHRTVS